MSTISRHSGTCELRMVDTDRVVVAEVESFTERESLSVVANKSVRISLRWNGRVYEGRAAGLDVESAGPTVIRTQSTARG